MDIEALGLIEVKGYLGAIEAADAALKAANVELIGCEKIKGGIVTVKITGDVGAVQSAVDAGAKASERLQVFLHSHVIPRLHEDTVKILLEDKKECEIDITENNSKDSFKEESKEEQSLEKEETLTTEAVVNNATPEEVTKEEIILTTKDETDIKDSLNNVDRIPSIEELKDLKVKDLRRLASKLKISSMTNKQIKFAKKDMLIEKITDFLKEES
ncbi:BMC domain-containing protein [Clostridium sp.]|uniref:BMC domain-containing protein n=1 Tax=Clostridium sp. TaxID=1506 RepID=UPI003463CEDA